MTRGAFADVSGPRARFGVLVIDDALHADHVNTAAQIAADGAAQPAHVYTGRPGKVDESSRRTKQVEIPVELATTLDQFFDEVGVWLRDERPERVVWRGRVSLLRYVVGDFFVPHRDRGGPETGTELASRSVSCVLFLNGQGTSTGSFLGGELLLAPFDDVGSMAMAIEPRPGRLVVFPSTMTHEVKPVTGGERYTAVTWYHDVSLRPDAQSEDGAAQSASGSDTPDE